MEGQYQCECFQVYPFTSVCNIWYKWEVCLGRKNPLELVVASEFSGTLFLCPAVGSRDMSGSADVPKWFSCCKPSDRRWERQPEIATEGKNQSFCPKSHPDGNIVTKDYSCWFVHKKHRWRAPMASPSSAYSIIPSGLSSILLLVIKHLESSMSPNRSWSHHLK